MPDVKQVLRKAVLNQTAVKMTLQDGENLCGMPLRDQNLSFNSSDSLVTVKLISEGEESSDKTKRIPVADIKEVGLAD